MITHPTSAELLDAVIGFLETRAAPSLSGRDVFLARVAVNALNVVKREMAEGPGAEARATERLRALLGRDGDFATLNAALAEGVRTGSIPDSPKLREHLKQSIVDQVRIDQPNYSGLKALTEA